MHQRAPGTCPPRCLTWRRICGPSPDTTGVTRAPRQSCSPTWPATRFARTNATRHDLATTTADRCLATTSACHRLLRHPLDATTARHHVRHQLATTTAAKHQVRHHRAIPGLTHRRLATMIAHRHPPRHHLTITTAAQQHLRHHRLTPGFTHRRLAMTTAHRHPHRNHLATTTADCSLATKTVIHLMAVNARPARILVSHLRHMVETAVPQ